MWVMVLVTKLVQIFGQALLPCVRGGHGVLRILRSTPSCTPCLGTTYEPSLIAPRTNGCSCPLPPFGHPYSPYALLTPGDPCLHYPCARVILTRAPLLADPRSSVGHVAISVPAPPHVGSPRDEGSRRALVPEWPLYASHRIPPASLGPVRAQLAQNLCS